MKDKQDIGIIGMGVMGKNLAMNIASKGYSVSVYDYWPDRVDAVISEQKESGVYGARTIEEFINVLKPPGIILLMVKAGQPVDDLINTLKPYLSKGDILIDGGNSFFKDTIRRSADLQKEGIGFIGTGISGGEEGALKGPAIMPGGSETAYLKIRDILSSIAAKVDGEACCEYMGSDGAGHFVKMVHNGIEYADMQIICEAYHILKSVAGLGAKELSHIFSKWNEGELKSYLVEITADIFTKYDEETGAPVVEVIMDKAGQKGTGMWTSQVSLELGVPAPTIAEAVFARYLSSKKEEREAMSKIISGPEGLEQRKYDINELGEEVRRALYVSKICIYAQGFELLRAASLKYGWKLDLGKVARVFRGGCIIRAQFLGRIWEAYNREPGLTNILKDSYFKAIVNDYQYSLRKVVSRAVSSGIPVPAFSSSISYLDGYRLERLPANLLQAQRDYFGAHTFERTDKEGTFHFRWY